MMGIKARGAAQESAGVRAQAVTVDFNITAAPTGASGCLRKGAVRSVADSHRTTAV
jgi:hypothetical protein